MSDSFRDCDICSIGYDAANQESLWCNMCGCSVGPCCKEQFMYALTEGNVCGGEMEEDKCPFCNKAEVTDAFLLHFALKKLGMSRETLVKAYKNEGAD